MEKGWEGERGWEGAGERGMHATLPSWRTHTHFAFTVKDDIAKTPGTLSHGTLVFEKGSDDPFRSLTMLDLWLSAKSKLQGMGEGRKPTGGQTLSPPFPVHCSQELLPTPWHHPVTHSPFPPSLRLPVAPSRQQWGNESHFFKFWGSEWPSQNASPVSTASSLRRKSWHFQRT